MNRRSIRFRLTVWYALVLLTMLALSGSALWFALRQSMIHELDEDLASRAGQLENYVAHETGEGLSAAQLRDELDEFSQALPRSSRLQLRGSQGFVFDYPPAGRPVRNDGVRSLHRSFVAGAQTFNLDLSASLHDIGHTLRLLQILLLSLLPLVIGAATLGGAWLSRRALKPVDDVARAALSTGIANLSRRIPVPQTGDELQRLTETWNATLGRLEGAVGTLSQFAADASHELRTPLAVIRTSAELALRRTRSPEGYRESLGEIAAEAERMTRLVEDLLLLARTDAQSAEMPKQPLDLGLLMADAATSLRELAQLRGIRIETMCAGEPVVTGNAAALRRLLFVLLDNAIKYSQPASAVLARVNGETGQVMVSVQDFGCGIRAEDQPHIFKRFYQADAARRDGGFGLGLSLAQAIARAHGADIAFISREGAGSTFSVRFAASQRSVSAMPSSSETDGVQPSAESFSVSSSLRMTPSGFDASKTTSPL